MARVGIATLLLLPGSVHAERRMETLDRAVVAVRRSDDEALVSWRMLGLDAPEIRFNLYRSREERAAEKLNDEPLAVSHFLDGDADRDESLRYFVRPVVSGIEQDPSIPFHLAAGSPVEPAVRIPIRKAPDHHTQFIWVGDLDGDGRYDFVLDRLPNREGDSTRLEAYTADGTWLWEIDLGPNSRNRDRYEPGPSAIDTGHWDGVTVYDFDSDGRAEVALRSADGVVFGNGTTLFGLGDGVQAISIIDGLSGAERAHAALPQDFMDDGPLAAHLGVAYLDGVRPSLISKLKNRVGRGGFNSMTVAWDFRADNTLQQRWKWIRGNEDAPDSHQIRVFDVDQDGRDEVCDGGYVLNSDGTFRYKVGGRSADVIHGDRFHLGDFDPQRPGLEGFIVQQDHPKGLRYLLYDAATGKSLRAHGRETADVGRGVVADIDPSAPGCEYWAFDGLHRIDTGKLLSKTQPWPNLRIWWDGDVLGETLNEGKVEKWDPENETNRRLFTVGSRDHGVGGSSAARGAPFFHGDILGDWREEIVSLDQARGHLIICSTNFPTEFPIYTLAHNPAYRVAMTVKGYVQDHHPDFFLGHDMKRPPRPDIAYTPRVLRPDVGCLREGGVSLSSGGKGFVGNATAVLPGGSAIEWSHVNGAGGGEQKLLIRYANAGSEILRASLMVNGTRHEVDFPPGGDWELAPVVVAMKPAAMNEIRLEVPPGPAPFAIDCIAVP